MPPSRSLFHLRFAFLVAWREGYLAETNKRLVVTAAHSCATLTYPPSFVLLVTAVKVVIQHSPSLLRWMRSATSASPDEARKEWRRGEWCSYLSVLTIFCLSCGHGARFRTGRNFLFCYFIIFFTPSPVRLIFWIGPSTFSPFSHGKVSKKVRIIHILMLGLIYFHWSCEPKLAQSAVL